MSTTVSQAVGRVLNSTTTSVRQSPGMKGTAAHASEGGPFLVKYH